jgi:HlyD family secretion protein
MLDKAQKSSAPDLTALLEVNGKGRRRWRWVIGAIVALAVVAGGWYGLSGSKSTAVVYQTAEAAMGSLTVEVTATGTVEPTNEVEVSSELSGLVSAVNADFNDTVKKGEVLATLGTDKLDANVTVARATVAARTADVRQADVTAAETAAAVKRAETLLAKQAITQEAFDAAKAASERADAALQTAKANLSTASANLTIAQNDRAKAEIVSPIDGVVLSRTVEAGQTVAASLSAPVLFTLAEDLTKMELQVDIDEADVGKVSIGDRATFTVAAYGERTFPATITQIRFAPETVEGVVTYKAILTVDNTDLSLRPGMTATANIVVDEVKDALLVPNAAFRFTPPAATTSSSRSNGLLGLLMPSRPSRSQSGNSTVVTNGEGTRALYVLKDGAATKIQVEAGATDGTRTAVLSGGLAAGDKVIVSSRSAK